MKAKNKEKELTSLEFVGEILKSTETDKEDVASKLPGGRSVSLEALGNNSDSQKED